MISLPIKLSPKQYGFLKEIKKTHGISMAGSIRSLIKMSMYGIGPTGANHNRDSIKRSRPVATGNAAYSGVVRELQAAFDARGKSK